MVASASDLLARVLREKLVRAARIRPDEWADSFRVLVAKASAEPGRWRTDRTPYWRRPLRLFGHPAVRQIWMMTGTQLGKSEVLDNLKLYAVDEDPGPTLVMFPDIDLARHYNQDRFIPTVEAMERVARHLLPSPQETKNLKINFDAMVMTFVGSNSRSGRRSRSIRYLFLDEISAYDEPTQGRRGTSGRFHGKTDPGWVEVFDRVKAFEDSRIVGASQPDDEGAGIDALYRTGSMEQYWVPCPHCGWYQTLRFARLKWDGGSGASQERALATARYECERCDAPIYDHHKDGMLKQGIWAPEETQREGREEREEQNSTSRSSRPSRSMPECVRRVIEEGHDAPGGLCDDPSPPMIASFQLSSLYSPFAGATFGHCAAAFVKLCGGAGGQVSPAYVNGWLGEPWKAIGDRLEVEELKGLRVSAGAGGYRLGFAPAGVLGITVAIDVQKDCCWVTARGWGERGLDSWLISERRIPREEGHNLVELDHVLDWTFPRWGGGDGGHDHRSDGRGTGVTATIVDSGHFTDECYKFVRRNLARGRRVWASKGIGKPSAGNRLRPVYESVLDKWPDGTPMVGGLRLLDLHADYWKDALLGRMRGRAEEERVDTGGTPVPQGGGGRVVGGWYLPEDATDEYLIQVTAEHRAAVVARMRVVYQWQPRPGMQGRNHFLDCECMQLALAAHEHVELLTPPPPPPAAAGKAAERAPGGESGGERGGEWAKDVQEQWR